MIGRTCCCFKCKWKSMASEPSSGCKVDFIPLHWYGSDWQAFTAYVADIHNTFKKHVWVTEWACVQYANSPPCNQNSVYNFMGATVLWLDQQGLGMVWGTADGKSRTGLGNQYSQVGGHA
eukprot:Phypoly_transcript_23577.p1 GENE.Phypoly_transcript_23577~~Phypoly_transcript_23577.p1  ORF type:complete len:120 (+),score=20.21 Phypoly_transcript_23577:30-389(+)